MRVSERTIVALSKLFTGDPVDLGGEVQSLAPYRSGRDLVSFFNELAGGSDIYASGFPARQSYVEEKLRAANDTPLFGAFVEAALHPREFLFKDLDPGDAINYANRFLAYDDLTLVTSARGEPRLRPAGETRIHVDGRFEGSQDLNHLFIREQLDKCDSTLAAGDYDGAITNARSLLEAVLREVERTLVETPEPYDGDLPKLFRRVQKLLNLDPSRKDINDALRQVLSGLTGVVAGLAPMRNRTSDAHALDYRPARHHAKLAANAAKTVAEFVFDTFEYQLKSGRISTGKSGSTEAEKGGRA